MLNQQDLLKEFPNANPAVCAAIIGGLKTLKERYRINTPLRLAHFLAQTSHESGGFRFTEENLNYSALGLSKVFPKYFGPGKKNPNEYHRQQEKIANVVYASRMGNGNTASGDGWRFKGRGLIQLTGRANYTAFAEDKNMPLEAAIDFLKTPAGALESAAWFWAKNGLNELADKDNVVAVTKRINGGTNGLDDRIRHTTYFKHVLGA